MAKPQYVQNEQQCVDIMTFLCLAQLHPVESDCPDWSYSKFLPNQNTSLSRGLLGLATVIGSTQHHQTSKPMRCLAKNVSTAKSQQLPPAATWQKVCSYGN